MWRRIGLRFREIFIFYHFQRFDFSKKKFSVKIEANLNEIGESKKAPKIKTTPWMSQLRI